MLVRMWSNWNSYPYTRFLFLSSWRFFFSLYLFLLHLLLKFIIYTWSLIVGPAEGFTPWASLWLQANTRTEKSCPTQIVPKDILAFWVCPSWRQAYTCPVLLLSFLHLATWPPLLSLQIHSRHLLRETSSTHLTRTGPSSPPVYSWNPVLAFLIYPTPAAPQSYYVMGVEGTLGPNF